MKVANLECNEGQIPDVPSNPRQISEERLEALKRSVSELPDMLSLRELLVYPQDKKYIVLGGNQRLVICRELGFEEVPCKIIPEGTPKQILRRIVMLDNEEFGKTDWEKVSTEWNTEEMKGWGVELPSFMSDGDFNLDSFFNTDSGKDSEKSKGIKIEVICPEDYTEEDVERVKEAINESIEQFEGVEIK